MVELTTVVLVIAALLAIIAALQPASDRLGVPATVLLAIVGVAIGAFASFLLYTPLTDRFNEIVRPIVNLPVRSSTFIYVFLPLLLFQAALTIDVPRLIEDLAPVLLLAVVAVFAATAVIGVTMSWLSGMSLIACLLLGSIVATTDPAAVVAIFRDIGAPARLSRLVEGEALLNDAAAIALFTLLLGLLRRGQTFDLLASTQQFLLSFAGGVVLGVVTGKLLVILIRRVGNHKAAEATLTLAAPYALFIVGDHMLHISGVVAVVTLGLCVSAWGRTAFLPENWQHLNNVWDQIAFWAGSLVFMMASILVPKLIADVRAWDAVLVLALVAAALAARALVLFALLPALSAARLTKPVTHPYKAAILWGGLRGAVTLALALAVVENQTLQPEVKRFVSVVATGFVLFTLLVNGTTLRAVIRALKLDRLAPIDRVLRDQIVALSLADVRDTVQAAAARYAIAPSAVDAVLRQYDERAAEAAAEAGDGEGDLLPERERLSVALIALAEQERQLLLKHHGDQTLSRRVADKLLRHAERIVEGARAEGRSGYNRAARRLLDFHRPFRIAHFVHRTVGFDRPLAGQLAERYELVLACGLIVGELRQFAATRMQPLFGARIAEIVDEMLKSRAEASSKAADALRLQYPDYALSLQRRFLARLGLRRELAHYEDLHEEGLLHRELYESLRRDLQDQERRHQVEPLRLDLRLDIRDLATRIDIFRGLDDEELEQVCKLFRRRLAVPGEFLVRKGQRGTSVFFISSGAVEVRLPGNPVRLGRGEFFGELALLTHARRTADIAALTYCRLLILHEAHFHRFLRRNASVRARIDRIVAARTGAAAAPAALPAPVPGTPAGAEAEAETAPAAPPAEDAPALAQP